MLEQILQALMTIKVSGNDVVTMSNCLQALQQVIAEEQNKASESTVDEDKE